MPFVNNTIWPWKIFKTNAGQQNFSLVITISEISDLIYKIRFEISEMDKADGHWYTVPSYGYAYAYAYAYAISNLWLHTISKYI